MLHQLFDWVPAVPEDAVFTVEVGDRARGFGGIGVSLVEGDQARLGAKVANVDGALAGGALKGGEGDRRVFQGQFGVGGFHWLLLVVSGGLIV